MIGILTISALLAVARNIDFREHPMVAPAIGAQLVAVAYAAILVRQLLTAPENLQDLFAIIRDAVEGDPWRSV